MPDKVTLLDTTGAAIDVPDDPVLISGLEGEGFSRQTREERTAGILEEEKEEAFGGRGLEAAGLGALSAVTLGLSDVGLSKVIDPNILREIRDRNSKASFAGRIGADVAIALASGGSSLLSKTPAGILARGATAAARTLPTASRAGRVALGASVAATEGALHGAGQYLSRQALDDDIEFSGEALFSSMRKGAVVGGILGGGAAAISGASSRPLNEVLEGLSERQLRQAVTRAGKEGAESLPYRSLIPKSKRTTEAISGQVGKVIGAIEDTGRQMTAARREVRDIFSADRTASIPSEIVGKSRAEVAIAMQQFRDATTAARRWQRKWIQGITPEKASKGSLPKLDPEEAEKAVSALTRVDEAGDTLQWALQRAREAIPGPAPVPAATPGFVDRLSGVSGAIDRARQIGVPIPNPIGPVLGAYSTLQALRKAASRRGSVPSTPMSRAAADVVSTRDRVAEAVSSAVSGASRRAVQSRIPVRRVIGSAMRSSQEVSSTSPERISATISDRLSGAPSEVVSTAVRAGLRAHEYLTAHAPRAPGAGTPFEVGEWSPSPLAAAQWNARYDAVEAPVGAIEDLLRGPTSYDTISADAVRTVYPSLWRDTQASLLERTDEIVKRLDMVARSRLGSIFGVPLTGMQIPENWDILMLADTPAVDAAPSPSPQSAPVHAGAAKTSLERRLARKV